MKKITLFVFVVLAFLLCRQNVKAQITLEHTYDSAYAHLYMVNLEVEGMKYAWRHWADSTIDLYNLDHSIFKSMPLAAHMVDSPLYNLSILYVSEHLFNDDDQIEYMLVFLSNRYHTYIINELGNIVFAADSAWPACQANVPQAQTPIYNTPNGTKMILSHQDGSSRVYSLPGTLTTSLQPVNYAMGDLPQLSAYPNPSDGNATIDFELPKGESRGEIILYNNTGIEVKKYNVDNTFNNLILSNSDLHAGTYFYQLVTAKGVSGSKKMIVIK